MLIIETMDVPNPLYATMTEDERVRYVQWCMPAAYRVEGDGNGIVCVTLECDQ